MILLSILIPTTPDRANVVCNILNEVDRQIKLNGYEDIVEVIVNDAPKEEMSIGKKRQIMHSMAKGMFTFTADSDDFIKHDYVRLVIEAIKSNPDVDCITYQELCRINGQVKTCSHSIKYSGWINQHCGFDFVRTPYFKDVIKTSIIKQVEVPDLRYGEDSAWAALIHPLLKTEIHIPEELYIYIYNHTPHNIRYGIK